MGIREKISSKPILGVAVASVLVIVAGVILFYAMRPADPVGKAFYTDDDGKTWFADRADLEVPVQRNGREVVLASVFKINDGKPYCAYMRRYTPDALKRLEARKAGAAPTAADAMPLRMEYKKPGDTQWHDIEGNLKAMSDYLPMSSPDGDMVQVAP
jgi:hypothetical protein